MKTIFKNRYLGIALMIFVIICYFLPSNDKSYNDYRCKTKDIDIRGLIDTVLSRKTNYMTIKVNNIDKALSLNPAKVLYRQGFNEYHFFDQGDSIIKKKGSLEVTIKNQDSVVVFEIDCKD